MRKLLERLMARRRDERGATFVLTAICMVLLIWGGAMGVDLGFTVDAGRQAQAMADTAALDLARYINIADAQASFGASYSYLSGKLSNVDTDNGSNITLTFTPGHWAVTNGKGQFTGEGPPSGDCWSFTPRLDAPCNAVMVTATQSAPQLFAGGSSSVSRSAVAEVTPEAGISVGSYLANVSTQQSGVLNAVLGSLGGSASITAAGYEGMANTYVSLNQLVQASGSLLTSSDVLTTSLTASQWLSIVTDAVANQATGLSCGASPTPSPCAASTAMSTLDFSTSSSAELCNLVTIDGPGCPTTAPSTAALSTSVNVLQLLTSEAEVANGTNAINLTSALGITGLSSASISFQGGGTVPQVAYGPAGASASTAQLTATLSFNVLGVGQISIPLSAAQATTTLSSVTCSGSNALRFAATLTNTTAVTGSVSLAGSQIATLSLAGVTNKSMTFAAANVPPTASTFSANTNPQQAGSTSLTPTFTGLSSSSPAYTFLTSLLSPVMTPVLQAAGVSVAGADVAFLTANCGAVSLAQ